MTPIYRACNACEWHGFTDRMLGTIGPLCPDCGETTELTPVPCPFCGSAKIDPTGWMALDKQGPSCDNCGATADSMEVWNVRAINFPRVQEAAAEHNIPYNTLCAAVRYVLAQPPGTSAGNWRGTDPDPHGNCYDCERATLTMGHLTDDGLANEAFLHYDRRPTIAEMTMGAALPIAYMTAVKDRIRWLSRKLIGSTNLLERCKQAMFNEFEPDNQSQLYKDIEAQLKGMRQKAPFTDGPLLEHQLFVFLTKKYIQRAGKYTHAETHDLAQTIAKFLSEKP